LYRTGKQTYIYVTTTSEDKTNTIKYTSICIHCTHSGFT